MPLYKVQWDGMGFTSRKPLTEKEMTEAQAARYTKQLQKAGEIPQGVRGVFQARVAPDEKEGRGEWKVFVGIELIVEAKNIEEVLMSDAPEELLMKVASRMAGEDADAAYDLRGTFEILDAEGYEESGATSQKLRPAKPKARP
jgi:hypothetical protein